MVDALSVVPSPTAVKCNGDNTGSATIVPSGGTTPFTYTWSPSVSSSDLAVNLSAGSYNVTVTDNFGCNATAQFNVTEPGI